MRITDSVTYTGVLNPSMRVFDVIMKTEFGTSYNSYIVKGSEKTAAIEAAHASFFDYYLDNVKNTFGDRPIDYIVLNHCEPDHSGCVARLLKEYPDITVVVSQAGSIYIKSITNNPDLKVMVVRDGDSIDLGGKTLQFINAPFLHWPDSMFTWLPEEKVLFSCDFLGTHFCEPRILDYKTVHDDKYYDALKNYYDAIFAPFSPYVVKGLDKIKDLDIEFACNSHGPILTKGGKLDEVISLYRKWSVPKKRDVLRIPIFYVSAYGNTRKLAKAIAQGIKNALPNADVPLYDIIEHDLARQAELMNESDAFLVGSPTINRDAVAPVWQLLGLLEAVNIQKRPVGVFGSFGWSGEATPHIVERLKSVKASVFEEPLKITFVPTEDDLKKAAAYGEEFGNSLT